jgi:basic amino acid/polyamine antiporter, APA family
MRSCHFIFNIGLFFFISSHTIAMSNELKQKLGLFSAVMVVVSAMIGSGVFKKIAVMSDGLHHSGWVLAAWGVAGLVTWMGSLSNAEVAGMIAKPGGQYVYFQTMYGKLFAFLFGWASFSVIQTATAASVAFVFAESFNNLFPLPQLPPFIADFTLISLADFQLQPFHNFGVKLVACVLVLFLSFINYRGIDYGERISNILGTTVVIGVFFIIILSFTFGNENNVISQTDAFKSINFMPAFFSAMLAAFWAYEGWNNVGFLGGEIKNAKKNIPIALGLGTLIVMVLYLLVNAAFFKLGSVDFYQNVFSQDNKVAAIEGVNQVWVYGGLFISILILVSTFNSTNNSLMTAPRIYYAMANDGLFIKSAAKSHHRFLTPHKSILYQMFWCLILIISGSFDMLTDMLVFVAFIFYGCGAFGVIVLRFKMPNEHRPFKVPLYPVLPILFTLFSAFLVYYSIQESPGNAIIGLLLVSLGFPIYYFLKNRST